MSRRRLAYLAILAVLLTGIAIGAIWDWINWHPMSAVTLTLVAVPLAIVGALLALARPRGTRMQGLVVLALGGGMVLGQVLGPARPELEINEGTMVLEADAPRSATGRGFATCSTTDAGDELQVSGDSNLRIDILPAVPNAPADLDQRAFVSVSTRVGDRWEDRTVSRSDDVDLRLAVGSVQADVPEVLLAASDASDIAIEWERLTGSLTFANLVEANGGEVPDHLQGLAGTITWDCDPG